MTSFSLSLAAADVLAQTLRVNIRQFPFDIPSVGTYQQDRIRIAKAVFRDLADRGLVRGGTIDPELVRAMRALSGYVITVAAMGTVEGDRKIYARAASTGETGVLAVRDEQGLRLELIRPTALAVTMVGLLPQAEAGPGQSVTLTSPAPAQRRAEDGEEDLFADVRPTNGSEHQLRIAASYLHRPRTGTGVFAVSGKDRGGRERPGGGLTWMDTDAGRYLTMSWPPGEDGQVRSTFSPADSARMSHALGELIESAAPRR